MTILQILAGAIYTGIVCCIAFAITLAACVYINEWTNLDVFWQRL